MSENVQVGLVAFIGFFFVSSLTWFFSSRRKSFIRTFVPPDELRNAVRGMRDEKQFRQGMRTISLLQFGVTFAILLVTLGAWLLA
jgi:hypothetical protein